MSELGLCVTEETRSKTTCSERNTVYNTDRKRGTVWNLLFKVFVLVESRYL